MAARRRNVIKGCGISLAEVKEELWKSVLWVRWGGFHAALHELRWAGEILSLLSLITSPQLGEQGEALEEVSAPPLFLKMWTNRSEWPCFVS